MNIGLTSIGRGEAIAPQEEPILVSPGPLEGLTVGKGLCGVSRS
jgi:hypothetical protein